MRKIGVFVCHCGSNIAGVVNVPQVVEEAGKLPDVAHAVDYKYLCSEPGQKLIREAIAEKGLDGVVIAACSPRMHESTFRSATEEAGLNPYQCEIANIREQCSWVHQHEKDKATEKATLIIRSMVEKTKRNEPLEPIGIPLTKRALVIGAGIAGIQAALDIANGGYEVVVVEKLPSIGGHMAQLAETFPTLDCSQCILTPKTVETGKHKKIKLLTYSEIEEVKGYVGNFDVKIRRKASYVDWSKCTGCGLCQEKCPQKVTADFEGRLGTRKAIYTLSPQAVPNKPVLDRDNCRYFQTGKCQICAKLCPVGAVDYTQQDTIVEEKVGALVVATGYDLFPKAKVGEYGYGEYADVLDGLQFERLLSASGPTAGEVRRPSDGKVPKEVVFVQCVGSRDPEKGMPYCSKICCMYTAKHAMLYKHKVPDGQAYVFYMDIRAGGKGYEEFVTRAMEEDHVLYLRGRVSRIFQDGDKLIVWGADTLSGKQVEIAADLVVLATAIVPSAGAKDLAQKLRVSTDEFGFFNEAHPKLRPVESLTQGVYLAGAGQAPRDIPEAVAQASGAASKVQALFSGEKLVQEPTIAVVDPEICAGCGICVGACPYEARILNPLRHIAQVNEALCQGCGSCVVACPNKATQLRGLSSVQMMAMIDTLV